MNTQSTYLLNNFASLINYSFNYKNFMLHFIERMLPVKLIGLIPIVEKVLPKFPRSIGLVILLPVNVILMLEYVEIPTLIKNSSNKILVFFQNLFLLFRLVLVSRSSSITSAHALGTRLQTTASGGSGHFLSMIAMLCLFRKLSWAWETLATFCSTDVSSLSNIFINKLISGKNNK